jgi:hypothetical protein
LDLRNKLCSKAPHHQSHEASKKKTISFSFWFCFCSRPLKILQNSYLWFYFFLGLGVFLGIALMPRISTQKLLTHALVNYKLWALTLIRVQWLEPFLLYPGSYIISIPLTVDHHQQVSWFWANSQLPASIQAINTSF